MTSRGEPGRPPLLGLALAGGESRRMGRPKWALPYRGRPQLEVVLQMLRPRCEEVFISAKEEAPGFPRAPLIADAWPYRSPSAGILSAMSRNPDAAWLVVACDLPLLDERTLDTLISARDPAAVATAYRSAHDALPEPLCAIWEPSAFAALAAAAASGRPCPRRFLSESAPRLLDLEDARALDNANTPEDYRALAGMLEAP